MSVEERVNRIINEVKKVISSTGILGGKPSKKSLGELIADELNSAILAEKERILNLEVEMTIVEENAEHRAYNAGYLEGVADYKKAIRGK